MKTLQHKTDFRIKFEQEIEKICLFYGLNHSQVNSHVLQLTDYFENYWEMVFAENDFELITSGEGNFLVEKISRVALELGLSEKTISLFERCYQAFPTAIIGIKLCFSQKKALMPTVYVRTKVDVKHGIKFLGKYLSSKEISDLQIALKDNQILYGLGFSEKNSELYLKTYTIGEIVSSTGEKVKGFVSYRLTQNQLLKEHKTYFPEVSLSTFQTSNLRLNELVKFLLEKMEYTKAGHIGILNEDDRAVEYKIYVERLGGIPTDFSAK